MNRLFLLPVLSASVLGLAACGSPEPDAVEATPGGEPVAVSDTRADTAATQTALALGLTRAELEEADLLSPGPEFTDLGDVETLVLDAAGKVTGLVIDLEGVDKDVVVPIDAVTSLRRETEIDLTTTMTAAQLQALPAYTGPGA
ncbi:PRC-barrel domain-containing protein [Brevundimonas staleyi]|uniref:PRC-barrel domain-containing protein n=1 Tax=Brevundimonas staleyi TaxID=74326 RepID=A0ABW0FP72_9CAUL